MTVIWLITWGCNSVLVRRLVVAKGQEHCLDGADENSSQAAIEDYIKDEDFNWKKRKSQLVDGGKNIYSEHYKTCSSISH